jgi:hypothetical protein
VHELGLQSFGLIPCADISRIGVELVVVAREFILGVPFGESHSVTLHRWQLVIRESAQDCRPQKFEMSNRDGQGF